VDCVLVLNPFAVSRIALAAILAVVLITAPPQVGRIHAARIVAGVEREHVRWRRLDALMAREREAMSRARAVDVAPDEAVAALVLASLPLPAVVLPANIDLGPEMRFNLFRPHFSHEDYSEASLTSALGGPCAGDVCRPSTKESRT